MWCPGVSALVTRLVYQGNMRGEGWGWGSTRYEVMAYVIPIGYGAVAYGVVWLTGLGRVDLSLFHTNVALFVVGGTVQGLILALGEELGWRGFLVPKLAEWLTVTRTALVSGAIWAAWHVPVIAFGDYNSGTPTWYAIMCFAVAVIAMAFPLAWLRLRSGSLWPAAIMHASHNLYIQSFFDRVTVDTGPTKYLISEFGAVLALTMAVTAWLIWRARG